MAMAGSGARRPVGPEAGRWTPARPKPGAAGGLVHDSCARRAELAILRIQGIPGILGTPGLQGERSLFFRISLRIFRTLCAGQGASGDTKLQTGFPFLVITNALRLQAHNIASVVYLYPRLSKLIVLSGFA
jgi:hypothetical protein